MVRPRRRGNRRLRLPGLSVNPVSGARALAATLAVTPQALSEVRPALFLVIVLRGLHLSVSYVRHPADCTCASSFYLLLVSHCLTRPSSICLLLMSLGLFVLRVVYLPVPYVRHPVARPFLSPTHTSFVLRVPFYLLLVSHCIARRSSICFLCSSFCRLRLRVRCLFVLRALLSCCTPRAPRGGKGIRLAGELGG
jgi:hypothetical protein